MHLFLFQGQSRQLLYPWRCAQPMQCQIMLFLSCLTVFPAFLITEFEIAASHRVTNQNFDSVSYEKIQVLFFPFKCGFQHEHLTSLQGFLAHQSMSNCCLRCSNNRWQVHTSKTNSDHIVLCCISSVVFHFYVNEVMSLYKVYLSVALSLTFLGLFFFQGSLVW